MTAYAFGVATSDAYPDLWFVALTAPFVIGCGVPVYRHGRNGAAGVVAGWLGVTAAFFIVHPTDTGLLSQLGWAFVLWLFIVLPVEVVAIAVAWVARAVVSTRRSAVL